MKHIAFALIVIAATPAAAAFMSADEVRATLSGNTLEGTWGKAATPYRQYFDANGETLFEDHGIITRGEWWVDDSGALCARWGTWGEDPCYPLERDGERVLWHDRARGAVYPSVVRRGRLLP